MSVIPDEALSSRAQLQREDLGPIVNYVALEIYDQAADLWNPESFIVDNISDLRYVQLSHLARDMMQPFDTAVNQYIHRGENLLTAASLEEGLLCARITGVGSREWTSAAHRLTYEPKFIALLNEGLATGIIMPLIAYRDMKSYEACNSVCEPAILDRTLDLEDASTWLRSRHFQALMLLAAHTRNGVYKEGSFRLHGLYDHTIDPYRELSHEPFEFIDGRPYFQKSTKKSLHRELVRSTVEPKNFQESDGCPARRATYPKLGKYAREFARQSNIDEAELRYPSRSAIVAGCEYVAHCLESLVTIQQTELASADQTVTA